jgi:hypothetical protein
MLLHVLEAHRGEADLPLFLTRRFDYLFSDFNALHDRRQKTIHQYNQ